MLGEGSFIRLNQVIEHPITSRLEVVNETDSSLVGTGLVLGVTFGVGLVLVLEVTGISIDEGTLAERVFITEANQPTLEVVLGILTVKFGIFTFSIEVTSHGMDLATEERSSRTEGHTPTFPILAFQIAGISMRGERIGDLAVLKVGGSNVGLDNTEIIGATKRHTEDVFLFVRTGFLSFVHGINDTDQVETAGLVGDTQAIVAVRRGLAFLADNFTIVVIAAEGVLSVNLEAGEVGRTIGDHVVVAVRNRRPKSDSGYRLHPNPYQTG